jgi:hypothetical protein
MCMPEGPSPVATSKTKAPGRQRARESGETRTKAHFTTQSGGELEGSGGRSPRPRPVAEPFRQGAKGSDGIEAGGDGRRRALSALWVQRRSNASRVIIAIGIGNARRDGVDGLVTIVFEGVRAVGHRVVARRRKADLRA